MSLRIHWAIWLVLLYLISLLSGAGFLQLLFALFLPMLLLSFAAVITASRLFSVSAAGEFSGGKNRDVVLPIRARNPFFLPLVRVSCRVEGVNRLTGEVFTQRVDFSVNAKQTRTVACRLRSAHCGRIEARIQSVQVFEWFGVLGVRVPCGDEIGITILPDTFDMRLVTDLSRSCPEDSDEYSPLRPGSDHSETFDVRDYRPGDSLRQIHWKLTQKYDHLMTKEASLPVDRSVVLMFDTAKDPARKYSPACFDAAAEVVTSLSQALLNEGVPHTLIWRDAAGGGIMLEFISSTEDLTAALPALLEGGYDDGISTLETYRSEKSGMGTSHIIAVCAAVPSVPDISFETPVTVLCTSEGDQDSDEIIRFGEDTYAADLEALVLSAGR